MVDNVRTFYSRESIDYKLGFDKNNVHQKILKIIDSGHKILDVGCSEGYLGELLKNKGNLVYGIEISSNAAEKAIKVLDDVIVGNIEQIDLPWPKEFFDIIICADIIEHLFEPEKVLTKLRMLLKREGRLIASIPNVANYWIRKELLLGRFEYQNSGLLDRGHIRFFTYDSAKKMLVDAGFEIINVDAKIELPAILFYPGKILKFIPCLTRKCFPKLFGYQFLFVVKKV